MPAPDRPLSERLRAPEVAEVPAAHLGLRWRRLTPDDVAAVLDLEDRCAEVDHPVSLLCPSTVTGALADTGMPGDSLGGFSAGGELEAMAVVYLPPGDAGVLRAFLVASIAPRWRGRGLGRALLEWQDGRARQLLAGTGREGPARIAAYVDEHLADRRRLYVAAGFSPKRVFQEMRRPVDGPLPEAPVPAGVRIVDWRADLDGPVRAAHNAVFADHWGSEPLTQGSWDLVLRELEPRWSKVALAPGPSREEVVGYAMTCRHEHAWPRLGRSEGYTELLGVRRDHRGRGLARALLGAVVAALAEDGIDSAGLDVDAANASGALGLYERLGYVREGGRILYTIEI
jgi:ribosomal protein S18 acetylase RimI-like enzyme